MDSYKRIEKNQEISVKDLAIEISEELMAACMGGVLENQKAIIMSKCNEAYSPLRKNGEYKEILLNFENGQSFSIAITENK